MAETAHGTPTIDAPGAEGALPGTPKFSAGPDEAARTALQCHGAIGYTFEYDLHLWMKRGWALAASWGDASFHRDRVGRELGI